MNPPKTRRRHRLCRLGRSRIDATAPGRPRTHPDPRFRQLLSLAREGNAEAVADLFRDFGFKDGEGRP